MNTFVTHPSVRVKGTETNFSPTSCTDPTCPQKKTFHMHCPFCVKTDVYHDPVILKMHYRVKHVDKGLEFAGLKILRCCDRCDIVGAIKGEKVFKGAHWHCYKCRNGFNRRDEAIKHYKTHFRNPHTTFQIQISQVEEYGSQKEQQEESSAATLSCTQEEDATIHPVLTEAVMSSSALGNGIITRRDSGSRKDDGEEQVSVAANETVGSSEGQTIMIIQEGSIDANNTAMGGTYTVMPNEEYSDDNSGVDSVLEDLPVAHDSDLQLKHSQLEIQCARLKAEKSQLKADLQELQNKFAAQSSALIKSRKREEELLQQLSVPLDQGIQELLKQLEKNHQELLHQQLGLLRRNYLNSLSKQNQTITIPSAALQNAVLGSESGTISITIQRNGLGGDGLSDQFSQETQDAPITFDGDNCKVINASDSAVLGLLPASQHQQLSVTEPFTVSCSSTETRTVTLPASDSYGAGLQEVVDSTEPYNFPSNDEIPVEDTCDISSSEIQETMEPPTKRSKKNESEHT